MKSEDRLALGFSAEQTHTLRIYHPSLDPCIARSSGRPWVAWQQIKPQNNPIYFLRKCVFHKISSSGDWRKASVTCSSNLFLVIINQSEELEFHHRLETSSKPKDTPEKLSGVKKKRTGKEPLFFLTGFPFFPPLSLPRSPLQACWWTPCWWRWRRAKCWQRNWLHLQLQSAKMPDQKKKKKKTEGEQETVELL